MRVISNWGLYHSKQVYLNALTISGLTNTTQLGQHVQIVWLWIYTKEVLCSIPNNVIPQVVTFAYKVQSWKCVLKVLHKCLHERKMFVTIHHSFMASWFLWTSRKNSRKHIRSDQGEGHVKKASSIWEQSLQL